GVRAAHDELVAALNDSSPFVRIAAAEALGQYAGDAGLKEALKVLVELAPIDQNGVFVSMAALNALDALEDKAGSVMEAVKAMPAKGEAPHPRYSSYVPRLLEDLQTRFK